MAYIEKIQAFAQAAKKDNFKTVCCEDADEFCEAFGKGALDRITGFVNAVSDRNVNRILARESGLQGQDYRDYMTSYENRCIQRRDHAASAIDRMNRFSKAMGLEPFADIDTGNYAQVEQVCGQVMLESIQDAYGGKDAFGKAVSQAKDQPGGEYAALQRILEQQDELNGPAAGPGLEHP